MRLARGVLLCVAAAACGIGGWLFLQANAIVVETAVINNSGLGVALAPARVIQLSDLHVTRFGYREKELVSLMRRIDPDIVFITGDFVSGKRGIPACLSLMEQITPGRAVIAVFGNNDHPDPKPGSSASRIARSIYSIMFPYDIRLSIERRLPFLRPPRMLMGKVDPDGVDSLQFAGELRRRKVTVLINQSVKVAVNGREIYVAGVDDNFLMYDDIFTAMGSIPDRAPAILLAHSPNIVEKIDTTNISLILSGHTHGGQIVIPGIGALFLNKPSRSTKRLVAGLYPDDTLIYVNRGIGTVMLPLRLFCRPEITFFTFEREKSKRRS